MLRCRDSVLSMQVTARAEHGELTALLVGDNQWRGHLLHLVGDLLCHHGQVADLAADGVNALRLLLIQQGQTPGLFRLKP